MPELERQSFQKVIKRFFDLFFSSLALLSLSPLMILVAAAVKLSSKGPVLFFQRRVGRNGHPFTILKFRSMRIETGLPITSSKDSRITPVGRVIRRSKIDELPQLLNILKGDMSIVGPRPELEKYVQLFPEEYQMILQMRPGLSDWASLEMIDEEERLAASPDPEKLYLETILPAKLKLQRRYVEQWSLKIDFQIIFRTFRTIFAGRST